MCKAALTKVSSTDEMQAGMNIPTFVFNPWIPDTVIRTTCIFLDNSSSIKWLQLPIFRKFEMQIYQKYLCRLNYLKQKHHTVPTEGALCERFSACTVTLCKQFTAEFSVLKVCKCLLLIWAKTNTETMLDQPETNLDVKFHVLFKLQGREF